MRAFAASLVLLMSHPVLALEIIDSRTEEFVGQGISATFKVENYSLHFQGIDHFGTRMAIQYRTPAVPELESYAVVQYFRGCQFGSSADGKLMNVSRKLFGELVSFQARDWLVDSVDVDPIYNSPEENDLSRHHYYRWSRNPDLFSNVDQRFYGAEKPSVPALHVTDRPGQAWYDSASGVADNISLEFKACLIRTEQVPRVGTPEKTDFGQTIHCFPWRSSFVFNHSIGKMEMPQAIDPFCGAATDPAQTR